MKQCFHPIGLARGKASGLYKAVSQIPTVCFWRLA